jgi:hypothetical protein
MCEGSSSARPLHGSSGPWQRGSFSLWLTPIRKQSACLCARKPGHFSRFHEININVHYAKAILMCLLSFGQNVMADVASRIFRGLVFRLVQSGSPT